MPILERSIELLRTKEFVEMSTADKDARPNSAPKLLLRAQGRTLYFIDYSMGSTASNLRVNPRACLSFMDMDSLSGYRIYGGVEVIDKGRVYNGCLALLRKKQLQLSVERVIRGVLNSKAHDKFELEIPERFLVYRMRIEEVSEITTRGEIKKEKSR